MALHRYHLLLLSDGEGSVKLTAECQPTSAATLHQRALLSSQAWEASALMARGVVLPSSPLEHSAPGTSFGEACWITFTNLSISELPQQPGCSEGALLLPAQQNSTVHLLDVAPRTGGNLKCVREKDMRTCAICTKVVIL